MDQAQNNRNEKILTITDYTFVGGSVGLFVNKLPGFFFSGLQINPNACWNPWLPKNNIRVINPNTSIYNEDFGSSFDQKYEIVEPAAADNVSQWGFSNNMGANKIGIQQKQKVSDLNSVRKPAMVILKDKYFTNGVYCVKFKAEQGEAMISIIFKYYKGVTRLGQDTEMFYTFDMVNSQKSGQFALRKFIDNNPQEIISVNKPINGLREMGYGTFGVNHVCIESINSQITIKMSQNTPNLYEVINVEESGLSSGLVGVGTFNTPAIFTFLELLPPQLNLTNKDVVEILKSDSPDIWMPSVTAIKRASNELTEPVMNDTAMNKILSLSNILGSVLGFNYYKPVKIIGQSESKTVYENLEEQSLGWMDCITAKNSTERSNVCRRLFFNEFRRQGCQKDFCNTCCETNIPASRPNVQLNCKKTCTKQTAAEENATDYKKVCLNSNNPESDTYSFCSNKFKDPVGARNCKLDLCQLCCVTMDVVRSKNYSYDSFKGCFAECAKSKFILI
jgi:hypothetical protein